MDIISHALVGKIFCFFDKKSKNKNWLVILFAIIPDLVLIPFYFVLGREYNRFLWIAQNQDWANASITHPFLTGLYNTTHSLFFVALIILPIVLIFKLPKAAFFAYLSHILFDIFTHTGEWSIQIFYPFNSTVFGISDAWAWPIKYMALSWLVLSLIIWYLQKRHKKNAIARHKS